MQKSEIFSKNKKRCFKPAFLLGLLIIIFYPNILRVARQFYSYHFLLGIIAILGIRIRTTDVRQFFCCRNITTGYLCFFAIPSGGC